MKNHFEKYLRDILNHPFLHYHPYLIDDEIIEDDAKSRAYKYSNIPKSLIEYMDQCCCMCYIGEITKQENPYTSEVVEYKTLPISFAREDYSEVKFHLNKSDFNPRRYLTVCGAITISSDLFVKEFCEKQVTYSEKVIKTASTVNGQAEIEKYQDRSAVLAYTIPAFSGFGSFRTVCRLYVTEDQIAKTIREQILRTQQYILCNIIHFPSMIIPKGTALDEETYQKYLPEFKQMYDIVCIEIKNRGIEASVKDEYLPDILNSISKYFTKNDSRPFYTEIHEETDDYILEEYEGLFAVMKYSCDNNDELRDRNNNRFKPRFRNSNKYIEDAFDDGQCYFRQIQDQDMILCLACNINPDDINPCEYETYDDEPQDLTSLLQIDNNDTGEYYYYDESEEPQPVNHYYLGLINKYGQTIFELNSLSSFELDRHTDKFQFRQYDERHVIICLSNSYDISKGCYTKCGAIDTRKGTVIIPLIFTEKEVKKELSCKWSFEDKRYYRPEWVNYFNPHYDDYRVYRGPIYNNGSDLLEQGNYAGYMIKDALYFHGKEILDDLIREKKIFIGDEVLPRNVAHFTPVERSIKNLQDINLHFNQIVNVDDVISTFTAMHDLNYNVLFCSLYEGKTIREIVSSCRGAFYLMAMVSNHVLKINDNVINQLLNEDPKLYARLAESVREANDYEWMRDFNY